MAIKMGEKILVEMEYGGWKKLGGEIIIGMKATNTLALPKKH
jgi:hypothetical protein